MPTLVPIRSVPKGEFFKRKPDAKTVYIRGDYYRDAKRFSGIDTEDINREILIKPDTLVFVGFTY